MSFSTSKPGKHGSAKVQFTGIDIFTSKKQVETYGTGDKMDAPVVKRSDVTFMSMDEEGSCQLMDAEGNIIEVMVSKDDEEVRKACEEAAANDEMPIVTVLKAMGKECIVDVKKASKK